MRAYTMFFFFIGTSSIFHKDTNIVREQGFRFYEKYPDRGIINICREPFNSHHSFVSKAQVAFVSKNNMIQYGYFQEASCFFHLLGKVDVRIARFEIS